MLRVAILAANQRTKNNVQGLNNIQTNTRESGEDDQQACQRNSKLLQGPEPRTEKNCGTNARQLPFGGWFCQFERKNSCSKLCRNVWRQQKRCWSFFWRVKHVMPVLKIAGDHTFVSASSAAPDIFGNTSLGP